MAGEPLTRPRPVTACAAIVPTRGRPRMAAELIDAFGKTAVCSELVFCVDNDDPALGGYRELMGQRAFTRHAVSWYVGPRQSLTAWTNQVALALAPRFEALVSMGDDHRPVTKAWDRKLLDAIRGMGGGWAYGDDGLQHENLPTAFMVSAPIVRALRWMLLPGCAHMFVDAAARDLGRAADRLAYLPHVSIRHLHYTSGLSPHDQTYADAYESWDDDEATYRSWLGGPIEDHADTVKEACA